MKLRHIILIAFLPCTSLFAQNEFKTVFEESNGLRTPTYEEGIRYFENLCASSDRLMIQEMGPTDSGIPLHLILFSHSGEFDLAKLHSQGKYFMLVNNAIHAGEPDGVDASMLFLRELTTNNDLADELQNVVVGFIPFYNIGGVLNRNSTTRINQTGPESYGFRGNGKNYDLNRDFIKMDSKNAKSFAEIFHKVSPDLFVDNHVSDGSDFQHVITLIASQHNKLGGKMGTYMHETLVPGLYDEMSKKEYDLVPYVNVFNANPDRGFSEFKDNPRYSSGYAALFQCFSFIIETHSLKPFKDRVLATYELNKIMAQYLATHGSSMRRSIEEDQKMYRTSTQHSLDWRLDRSVSSKLMFKGYESELLNSDITGSDRLKFDRNKPYQKEIDFYDTFNPTNTVNVPAYYIVPQAWDGAIERLRVNNVETRILNNDSSLTANVYHIVDYQSSSRVYEGHHLNSGVEVKETNEVISLRKGDYLVPVDQLSARYIIEVLEPQGPDSFFAWNFFDTILQQKEYFSPYLFEDIAPGIFEENPELKKEFDEKVASDSLFAANSFQKLDFIYQNSKYREKNFLRYPIYRIMN